MDFLPSRPPPPPAAAPPGTARVGGEGGDWAGGDGADDAGGVEPLDRSGNGSVPPVAVGDGWAADGDGERSEVPGARVLVAARSLALRRVGREQSSK